ncbi:MAG: cohesin domain-containing protein [Planctomycetota bacterium]
MFPWKFVIAALLLVGSLSSNSHAQYQLVISDVTAAPGDTIAVTITLIGAAGVQGLSMGVCHDPVALELIGLDPGPLFDSIFDPDPLNFVEYSNGFTIAYASIIGPALPAGPILVATVSYTVLAPLTSDICACPIGSPPVQTYVVVGGSSLAVTTSCGTVAAGSTMFMRGDISGDDAFDLGDIIAMLAVIFQGAPAPGCADAADTNDDGVFNLADPIYGINYLYVGGPPPPGGVGCASDGSLDPLDCDLSGCL